MNIKFLAAIAALDVAMSVGRSVGRLVGWSVGVNEFQRVLNALKVHVMNMLQGIYNIKYIYAYYATCEMVFSCNRTSISDNFCWSVGLSASNKFQSYNA